MKKRIIFILALIFSLFAFGTGVTTYNFVHVVSNLRNLVSLHEIETLRHELNCCIYKIQAYTMARDSILPANIDEIRKNTSLMDVTIKKCIACHHTPAVQTQLADTASLINQYKEKLRQYTFVDYTKQQIGQGQLLRMSFALLDQMQKVVDNEEHSVAHRTSQVIKDLKNSSISLAMTVFVIASAAFFIAKYLIHDITGPINSLRTATTKIASGELGYVTDCKSTAEFGTLIDSFNKMSVSLEKKEKKILDCLEKSAKLHQEVLAFHSAQDMATVQKNLISCMTGLMNLDKTGVLLLNEENGNFTLTMAAPDLAPPATPSVELLKKQVLNVFHANNGRPLLSNDTQIQQWPFPFDMGNGPINNFCVYWLAHNNDLLGALLAVNKNDGDFQEEDRNVLSILANNLIIASKNIELYKNRQYQIGELKKTQRQLMEAEKLTAIGTLAGGIAHDFNNILCGMIGHIALLKMNYGPNDNNYRILNTVEQAGFRAASLIKQLLAFARQATFEFHPIDINENVHNVIELFKNTIPKLITIRLNLAESLPLVEGDPAQLEQVLMILCINARDAMPDGGNLVVKTKKIRLDEQFCLSYAEAKPGDYVKLTVVDSGMGIEEKNIPRIFEPFFTTKELGKGIGLGLSMAYGIVKSHGGFCLVDSKPNQGTEFSVYLPAFAKNAAAGKTLFVRGTYEGGDTILIADDEEVIVSMLTAHLKNLDCTVLHAKDGEETLKLLLEHKAEIDLIILDINMPVMDGQAAYHKIKEISPDIKVLVSSGYGQDGIAQKMLDSGAQGFIQKPFSLEDISAKINEVLKS